MRKSKGRCTFRTGPLAGCAEPLLNLDKIVNVGERYMVPIKEHDFVGCRVVQGRQEVCRIGDLN